MQNNIFAAICETLLQTSLVHLSLLCPTCFLAMYALSLMPKNHYLPTLNWWKYLNLKSSEEKEVLTSNTHSHDLHLKKSSHRASNFWNRKHIYHSPNTQVISYSCSPFNRSNITIFDVPSFFSHLEATCFPKFILLQLICTSPSASQVISERSKSNFQHGSPNGGPR